MWCLNLEQKSPTIQISGPQNMTATHVGFENSQNRKSYVVGTHGFTSGIFKWKVKIDAMREKNWWIAVGVVEEEQLQALANDVVQHYGCLYGCGSNKLMFHAQGDAEEWGQGDEVSCTLDMETHILTIVGPGTLVTAELPKGKKFYPAYIMYAFGNQITVFRE